MTLECGSDGIFWGVIWMDVILLVAATAATAIMGKDRRRRDPEDWP